MKLHEIIAEEQEVNLIGKKISGLLVTGEAERWPGNFICTNIKLTSLKGSPKVIGGTFDCSSNKLTSIIGGPVEVDSDFHCGFNKLKTLDGAPKVVKRDFLCYSNDLSSLRNIHKIITRIDGCFDCEGNLISSHVLGLLLITGLTEIRSTENLMWIKILNRYVGRGKAGLIECQNELIEAGLEEFAQL